MPTTTGVPAEAPLPVMRVTPEHREKCSQVEEPRPFRVCMAHGVKRQERLSNPQAQAALQRKWGRLRACGTKGCWDERAPKERSQVAAERKAAGTNPLSGGSSTFAWRRMSTSLNASPAGGSKAGPCIKEVTTRIRMATGRSLQSCPSAMATSEVADFYSSIKGSFEREG